MLQILVLLFLGLVAGVLRYWGLIEMLFLKETSGPNRFGPDPLATVSGNTPAATLWDQQEELEFVPHGAGPSAGSHVMRAHD